MYKEFRAWFMRDEPKTTGSQPDQEIDYPLEININGTPRYHRFLKGNIPSEKTWRKLFESILFKLNAEDRAKDQDMPGYFSEGPATKEIGGHVTLATDSQAKGDLTPTASKYVKYEGVNGDENLYSRVPRVSHLPTVDDIVNTTSDDFTIDTIDSTIPNTIIVDADPEITTRNHFIASINPLFRTWLVDLVTKLRNYINSYELSAELVYNDPVLPDILVIRTPATGTEDHKDKLIVNIKDITFNVGTVSGSLTIGSTTVSIGGTTVVEEIVPGSREYRVNITINTL